MTSDTASDSEFEDLLTAATGTSLKSPKPKMSVIGRVLWALAALPFASLLLLGSMAVRVRLADGAWPMRNQPDPKELGIHNTVTVLAVVASIAIVLIVPLLALAARLLGQERTPVKPPIVAIVGFVLMLLVIRADPGGLGSWLAD